LECQAKNELKPLILRFFLMIHMQEPNRKLLKETDDVRKIMPDYNKKDKLMMEKLSEAIKKINALHVIGPQGKRMEFSFEKPLS